MGIFSKTKTPTSAVALKKTKLATVGRTVGIDFNLTSIIKKPLLTEKATTHSDQGVYTFMVVPRATKYTVSMAIKEVYGVTPMKVNIVNKLAKKSLSGTRGRMILETGYKKAYVYLKKGDTINVV